MSDNPYACQYCVATTSGRCWRHGGASINVTEQMARLVHVHEWRLAGQLADGQALLVCAHHDPPYTRTVRP